METFFRTAGRSYRDVTRWVRRNKVLVAGAASAAGTYYIYSRIRPYLGSLTEAKLLVQETYAVLRDTVSDMWRGGGRPTDRKMDANDPLFRQFIKAMATGDRLLDMQIRKNPFAGADVDAPTPRSLGLHARLRRLFDLDAIRAGLRTGKRDEQQYILWGELTVSGLSQLVCGAYALCIMNATTKTVLSMLHRYLVDEHVRARSGVSADRVLEDPAAFQAFVAGDPELSSICRDMPFQQAIRDTRVVQRVREACQAARTDDTRTGIYRDPGALGERALGLAEFALAEGLELLAIHVRGAVQSVVDKYGLAAAEHVELSLNDLLAILTEVREKVEDSVPSLLALRRARKAEAKESQGASYGAQGGDEEDENGDQAGPMDEKTQKQNDLERAWGDAVVGTPTRSAAASPPASPPASLAVFAVAPASAMPGRSPSRDGPSRPREDILFSDILSELRKVVSTRSFASMLDASVDAAFARLFERIRTGGKVFSDVNAKLDARVAVVRLTKMFNAFMPGRPKKSKSSSTERASARAAEPRPPRDPSLIEAVKGLDAVTQFCKIIFFPMDGRAMS